MNIPHLVQYQGSKRMLAGEIIKFFPKTFNRLIEPFAGSAAISIACAAQKNTDNFIINDLNPALSNLLKLVINQPNYVAKEYKKIWEDQHINSEEHYKKIREEFNRSEDPVMFLYLLARCVKGSVRYNTQGEFNQGVDKRRFGTNPEKMKNNIYSISMLLKNKSEITNKDYRELLSYAKKGDLVYMDPPYQGVCGNRDSRYYSGIEFESFVSALDELNRREVDYVISYDGKCGNKNYGEELPKFLKLKHISIDAGRSSQATLLGRDQKTIESLYISKNLNKKIETQKKSTCVNVGYKKREIFEAMYAQ